MRLIDVLFFFVCYHELLGRMTVDQKHARVEVGRRRHKAFHKHTQQHINLTSLFNQQ